MNTAQAGGNPEAVFCAHLNHPVQGKVSARHPRVTLFPPFFPADMDSINTGYQNSPAPCGDKKRLRGMLRAARRGLGEEDQQRAARGLLAQLEELEIFRHARRIALYLPNDGEIDTGEVIRWCRRNGRQPYLPVVQREGGRNWLLFGEYREDCGLSPNNLGIPEPVLDPSELVPARELDLVLLPLVGFDLEGNRIGMGGGFYDTTFEFIREDRADRPVLIGIAHEVQKVERIDVESWDIPLPMVVTDQGVYRFGK